MDAQEQRRLLELAAKAVGFIDDATDESGATGLHRGSDDVFYITNSDGWREWNPLVDDGDALRLAVKLILSVDTNWYDSDACWLTDKSIVSSFDSVEEEPHNDDPYAATRLAIVRAAAVIGEKMEEES